MIQTGLLTNRMLELLRAVTRPDDTPMPVGDMEIPDPTEHSRVGWDGRGPNTPGARFNPYGILLPLPSSQSSGGLVDSQADWRINYVIQSYGVSRDQVQLVADLFRSALKSLTHEIIELEVNYKVQQVEINTVGGVDRVPGANPAYFGQQDQFTVWLAKRRS